MLFSITLSSQSGLKLNDKDYFEMQGLNVMVFSDFYPEGHQTGVTFIQHGERIAANGDIRLEPTPGQWQPVPKAGKRIVDKEKNEISVDLWYPDSGKDKKGFNPVYYPDLVLKYKIRVRAEGQTASIIVDLEKPLPEEWVGKVGFNLELFPGALFGKSFILDDVAGIFPPQANGPMYKDTDNEFQIEPMAAGNKLVVAPEIDEMKITIYSKEQTLSLIDGRSRHNNGWFVVRSLLPAGKTSNALEWEVTANVIPDWKYKPVVQVSQVGYHTLQTKTAVIELDKNESEILDIKLVKYDEEGNRQIILNEKPKVWGEFLRYRYLQFNFSKITEPGIYQLMYGDYTTNIFKISNDVFKRHVWQPTLEYFLPVQMCHMRVNEGYRVWHGLCHDDDALMAPTDINHFDGYLQGPSTLTKYKSLEHVPGLNAGGWHDAGDYDLRVESQSQEAWLLSTAYEEFNLLYDDTMIDQAQKLVEIHKPDGKPDILQQVEHGVLSIVNGYKSLGRLYRGIISEYLWQYVLLGDGAAETDLKIYDPSLKDTESEGSRSGIKDDRFVFTEENPYRELLVSSGLAASSRALKDYNPGLSMECLQIAEAIWGDHKNTANGMKIVPAVELFLTTGKDEYKKFLIDNVDLIVKNVERYGWTAGRTLRLINDQAYKDKIMQAVENYYTKIIEQQKENPYGVPYKPAIWGAGWEIQQFGVHQYFLHKEFPEIFKPDYMLNALNFILGCHPGSNTASFASGVGAKSLTVAYGINRADWSYIPGGVGSGTALIRPDLPELKVWPYFWQQTEYVMGGGASNFMFLVLAVDKILGEQNEVRLGK